MTPISQNLSGVQAHFIDILAERCALIAQHSAAALDAKTPENARTEYLGIRNILHQIAGTAPMLGFKALGHDARLCENQIVAHLEGPAIETSEVPMALNNQLKAFLATCDQLLCAAKP
jgi:HPt (histidine-containing phosphotransfer) domain-containing protein